MYHYLVYITCSLRFIQLCLPSASLRFLAPLPRPPHRPPGPVGNGASVSDKSPAAEAWRPDDGSGKISIAWRVAWSVSNR